MRLTPIYAEGSHNFRPGSEILTEYILLFPIDRSSNSRYLEAEDFGNAGRPERARPAPTLTPVLRWILSLGDGVWVDGYPRGAGRKVRALSFHRPPTKPLRGPCLADRLSARRGKTASGSKRRITGFQRGTG